MTLIEYLSGLDSYSATQVMELLKKVANAGTSVLFTIHQPSSEVFASFDHLILLNRGHVMYQGAVQKVPTYFENCSHPIPANYNPADWIMTVAQRVEEEDLIRDGFYPQSTLESRNYSELDTSSDKIDLSGSIQIQQATFFTQTRLLFVRELRNLKRDTAAIGKVEFDFLIDYLYFIVFCLI